MTTTENRKYQLNQINLYGADVKLFTTRDSNGIWYVKTRYTKKTNTIGNHFTQEMRTMHGLSQKTNMFR